MVPGVPTPEDVLEALNKTRANPTSLVPLLEERLKRFNGKVIKAGIAPGIDLVTQEGPDAVKECIRVLQATKPLEPFGTEMPAGMLRAAADHVADLGPSGRTGHTGSDGSQCSDRLRRYGAWQSACAENIDFGSSSGEEVLVSLLIDDGVKSRGHRTNILDPRMRCAGIASGRHKEYGTVTVMVMAGGYGVASAPSAPAGAAEARTVSAEGALPELPPPLREALEAAPFPAFLAKAEEALKGKGTKVAVTLGPGTIELKITTPDLSTSTMTGSWS
mmetsp:Transcript_15247/g.50072  ORF Transcript_15247/g.50072 Transcript_15247/m.50072 type:complete len:275 (-) Transcript_15247:1234-2058(-)